MNAKEKIKLKNRLSVIGMSEGLDSITEKERVRRSQILFDRWGFKTRTWTKYAKESDGYKGYWCWTGDWCREMIMFHQMGMINLYKEYPQWEVDEIFKVAQVGSLKRLSETKEKIL